MKKAILFLSLFFATQLFAASIQLKVIKSVPDSRFDLAVGSEVELKFEDRVNPVKYLFLGKMVLNHDFQEEIMVLDEKKEEVLFLNAEDVAISKRLSIQTIVTPMDQATSTCGAFALYNFWNQLRESHLKESVVLDFAFSTQRNRMQFLEEAISRYYISNQTNLNVIMRNFGGRLEYKCREVTFDNSLQTQNFLFDSGSNGSPVVVEFWIGGSEMFESKYQYKDFESQEEYDQRLWIPRKMGERKNSGHMIVIAASFQSKGKRKLLILDSNWQQPRIWDLDDVLGPKTAVKDLIFHDCK